MAQRSKLLPDDGVGANGSTTTVITENTGDHFMINNVWGGSRISPGNNSTEWQENSFNPKFDQDEIVRCQIFVDSKLVDVYYNGQSIRK